MDNVWINEFHYDNSGTDIGEFIEIAGLAGSDLSHYMLYLINGAGGVGEPYESIALSGIVPDMSNGLGVLSFSIPGIQNGGTDISRSADGIALVNGDTHEVQFISYEGSFSADITGLLMPVISQDVGQDIYEDGAQNGTSIGLIGTGTRYSDFNWAVSTDTHGTVNDRQSFDPNMPAPGNRNDILNGTNGDDVLNGFGGNDKIFGGLGNDQLIGGEGRDHLDGGDGIDTVSYARALEAVAASLGKNIGTYGEAIGDTYKSIENLIGSAYNDALFGDRHDNLIDGSSGDDDLEGGAGNDTLLGGAGEDLLRGGKGIDILTGNIGNDTFVFDKGDTGKTFADADTITDFVSGSDSIDVSNIDANIKTKGEVDSFVFIGTAAFDNRTGELRYEVSANDVYISGDWNGDGKADFVIHLAGVSSLNVSDLIL